MAEWVKIAEVGELAPGEKKQVDLDGLEVALFNVDGDYFVIEDVCTHDGRAAGARQFAGHGNQLPAARRPLRRLHRRRAVHAGHRAGGYL